MAFGRKKKEAEPVVEEAEVIEEKEWISPNSVFPNNQGGEPHMEAPNTEDLGNGEAKRTRTMVTDHWVDQATAAAFEEVRAKIGPGTSIRTVTDKFFDHPARIYTELPEPPPIESYSAAEIGAKVKAALTADL